MRSGLIYVIFAVVVLMAGIVPPYGISGGLVSFVTSLVLFIGISLITQRPELEDDIDAVLNI